MKKLEVSVYLHVENFKVSMLLIVSDISLHKGICRPYFKKNVLIPINVSRSFSSFRRSGYGLEITIRYHFVGPAKAIDWLNKESRNVKKELECHVCKCLK